MDYINKNKFLDYNKEELIGESFLTLLASNETEFNYEKICKLIRKQEEKISLSLKDKNNIKRDFSCFISQSYDSQNEIIILLKSKKNQIRNPEKDYQFIIESLNDIISVFDENFNLLYINKAQNNISGFSKREVIGRNPKEFIHSDDIENASKMLQDVFRRGVSTGEFRMRTKSGNYIWLEVNMRFVTNSQGEKNIIVSSRDIEKRKRIQRQLKNSEKRYLHLFDNSPFAILLLDLEGKIIEVNSSTIAITGYEKENLIGKKFHELSIIHPSYLSKLVERFKKIINGEKLNPVDVKIFKKHGEEIWVNFGTSIVRIEDKKFIQAIGYDISDQKKAEILIKQEVKKLRELEKMRRDIIVRVSHELKTPLISIIGGAEYIGISLENHEINGLKEIVDMIERGGDRLKKLVDRLLDVSKIEFGKLTLDRQNCNLSQLVKDVIKNLEFLINKRDIKLSFEIQENIILKIDLLRMEQVITNLISNAIKNTKENGNIYVDLTEKNDFAILTVKDNGIGLTESEMKKIFKRFGKIEREGEGLEFLDMRGSGLGLFISKEIVQSHGGTISAQSEGRGKGSKFTITLPVNKK